MSQAEAGSCRGLWVVTAPEGTDVAVRLATEPRPPGWTWQALASDSVGRRWSVRQLQGASGIADWALAGEVEAVLAALPGFDLIVFCPLSLNSLAKIALGIADAAPARVALAAMTAGQPLLLDLAAVPARDQAGMNPHLIKVYRGHADRIIGGRVAGFAPGELAEACRRFDATRRRIDRLAVSAGRTVVTRDDVIAAHLALQPIRLRPGDLLTPLARDEAAALGVPIVGGS